MSKMPKRYFIPLGISIFILVGITCIRPVSTGLIRDAYIGSAFSFRINDVIALAYPEMELDKAIEMQELVEKHPQLDKIIHNYLCAYGDWLQGDYAAINTVNNENAFERMNQNILAEAQGRNPGKALSISEEEFISLLVLAEEEIETILQNNIPQNLQNYGILATVAINIYTVVTSVWLQGGLILLIGMLIAMIYKRIFGNQVPSFCKAMGRICLMQGILWAVIFPVCIKMADWRLLGFVDSILGRSMFIDVTTFLWRGLFLLGLGITLLIYSGFEKRRNHR